MEAEADLIMEEMQRLVKQQWRHNLPPEQQADQLQLTLLSESSSFAALAASTEQ